MTNKHRITLIVSIIATIGAPVNAQYNEPCTDTQRAYNRTLDEIKQQYIDGAPAFYAAEARTLLLDDYAAGSYYNAEHGGTIANLKRAQDEASKAQAQHVAAVEKYNVEPTDENSLAVGNAETAAALALCNVEYFETMQRKTYCRYFDACLAANVTPAFDVSDAENNAIMQQYNLIVTTLQYAYHDAVIAHDRQTARACKQRLNDRASVLYQLINELYEQKPLPALPVKPWRDYSDDIDELENVLDSLSDRVDNERQIYRATR